MPNEAVGGWTDPEDLKKMIDNVNDIENRLEEERKPRESSSSVRNRLLGGKKK